MLISPVCPAYLKVAPSRVQLSEKLQTWLGCSLLIWTILVTGCATIVGLRDPSKIAMMTAAAGGDTGRVKELIAQGTEVNFIDRGLSPLGAAIIGGHIATARALLEGGAAVDLELENGNRALAIAARRGSAEIVKLLLAFHANPKARNHSGETALQLAAWDGHAAIVQPLVSAGADPNDRDSSDATPLLAAASREKTDVVKALIQAGADVNAGGLKNGVTALLIAAGYGHITTVRTLIAAGADVNASAGGVTALRIAAAIGNALMAKDLVAAGARINDRDAQGRTALTLARQRMHGEVVKILRAAGAKE
jgi:ankyrin repeat protein